jgi:hypothetical protein
MPEGGKTAGRRTFDLALPVMIQGLDSGQREFTEQCFVSTINAEEAVLRLRSRVEPGTKVRLSLRVPRTFFLENPLDLNLTGTILELDPPEKGVRTKAAVRVRLDGRFRILPVSA